jgi:ABC-2 type transport system permease protein
MSDSGTSSTALAVSAVRIRAVMHRHLVVLLRSPHRWFEISFWPVMDVLLWGSLGVFVAKQAASSRATSPYLLAGITMFWVFTQAQFSIALGVNEETWTRNILNVLTTPISELEYFAGIAVFGLVKLMLCIGTLSIATAALFGFDLSSVGWPALPVALLLVINGWALGLIGVGLVLRFGQSAEILIWGVNYAVLSFSGVFFPSSALPKGIEVVARQLPTTQLFAAIRLQLDGGGFSWSTLAVSAVGSLLSLVLAAAFCFRLLRVFRRRGFVTRYS